MTHFVAVYLIFENWKYTKTNKRIDRIFVKYIVADVIN